jgi:CheY-like chemotaxis protein
MAVIILVDDNDRVRAYVSELLRDAGLPVFETSSAREALAADQRLPGSVDVLVTDIEMPEMNGRELARRMVEAHPALRVLYISGIPQAVVERNGPIEPWAAFLAKPFGPVALMRAVRALQEGTT